MLTIHAAFARSVARRPEAVAVAARDRAVDYRTLDVASNLVAEGLADLGVGPGRHVPVLLPRSPELVAVLLGILKLGASYAALDRAWPDDRIVRLCEGLGAPLVLPAASAPPGGVAAHHLPGGEIERWAKEEAVPPLRTVRDDDPAAVFFTSGTTGAPKAVVTPHRATVGLLVDCDFVHLGPGTVMPLASPVPWDAFSLELWGALLNGGTSVIVDEPYLDTQALHDVVRRGANTAWMGASLFNVVVDEDLAAFTGLEQLMIGGEKLSVDHVRRFVERYPAVRLVNGYGPVESTIFATTHPITLADCHDGAGVPIGRPVADTEVFVLSRSGACGPGEVGEICIASPRLAHGYLGDDVATAERFIHREVEGRTRRVYRTGDLGHYGQASLLHYDGRLDRQVKLRGHRVEPEEVEHALSLVSGVSRCAVAAVVDEEGSCTGLVAYYTSGTGEVMTEQEVRAELARTLPAYMVPDRLTPVDELPLLPSGKLDRRAFARVAPGAREPEDHDDLAGLVRATVADVLGIERVADDASFFDLGGSSLDVGRVCARLSRRLDLVVPVSQMIREPSVGQLACWIEEAGRAGRAETPQPATAPREVPLLPIQVAFLLANQISSDVASNCPFGWWVDGPLERDALAAAIRDVELRHEALRARYLLHDPPVAGLDGASASGTFRELPISNDEQAAFGGVSSELMQPLDLSAGEVWRVLLAANVTSSRSFVGVVVHHIAWDGDAELILVRDLTRAYRARCEGATPVFPDSAPSLATMHSHYHRQSTHARLDEQRKRWSVDLAGLPVLDFGDRPDPTDRSAGALDVWISSDDVARCNAVTRAARATRFAGLFTAFAWGVAEVTGQDDFGVGVPVTKRNSAVLGEGVNCLIDLVCVRARIGLRDEPGSAVRSTGEQLRSALAGQDIAFDEVVRLVNPTRGERPPLYQTMFTLEPKDDPGLRLAGCELEFVRLDPPVAMTELGCALWPQPDGGYRAHLIFRHDRVESPTVAAIAEAMLTALRRDG